MNMIVSSQIPRMKSLIACLLDSELYYLVKVALHSSSAMAALYAYDWWPHLLQDHYVFDAPKLPDSQVPTSCKIRQTP